MLNISVSAELAAKRIKLPYLIAKMLNHVPRITEINPDNQYRLQTVLFYLVSPFVLASLATFSIENFIRIRDKALKKHPKIVKSSDNRVSWNAFD